MSDILNLPMVELHTALPGHARVWLYVAERTLSEQEQVKINALAKEFTQNWTAHNRALRADAFVLYHQILVLAVDESQAEASGCSIDKSTHFVEELSTLFSLDFFTRDLVFILEDNGNVRTCKLHQLSTCQPNTIVLNTLAKDINELRQSWKPISQSWHRRWL